VRGTPLPLRLPRVRVRSPKKIHVGEISSVKPGFVCFQNRLRQKSKRNSQTCSHQRKDKRLTQQHAHDVESGETQCFENPDPRAYAPAPWCAYSEGPRGKLTTIPRATIVRVKGRNCGKFDEVISVTYSAKERTLYSGINLRICARARGFRISFASHVKHRNALLRPRDLLRRSNGNEVSRAPSRARRSHKL